MISIPVYGKRLAGTAPPHRNARGDGKYPPTRSIIYHRALHVYSDLVLGKEIVGQQHACIGSVESQVSA